MPSMDVRTITNDQASTDQAHVALDQCLFVAGDPGRDAKDVMNRKLGLSAGSIGHPLSDEQNVVRGKCYCR